MKKQRGTNHDGTKVERRKTQRFPVSIPMEASWCGPDGKPLQVDAVARQVNRNGGHLEMETYPEFGTRISLVNLLSAEAAEARVLATPHAREGVSHGIIVELVSPTDTFWGVNLQVKKTGVELRKLESALRTEGIDLRLLKEFRDAMEYVHLTAQVVQQLREVQLRGGEPDEVLSMLASKRLEWAQSLCLGVLSDLESSSVNHQTKSVEEFYRCIDQIHSRLQNSMASSSTPLLKSKVKLSHGPILARTDA